MCLTRCGAVASVSRIEFGECRSRRSEEHTSELQSRFDLVCRLLLEKKNQDTQCQEHDTQRPGGDKARQSNRDDKPAAYKRAQDREETDFPNVQDLLPFADDRLHVTRHFSSRGSSLGIFAYLCLIFFDSMQILSRDPFFTRSERALDIFFLTATASTEIYTLSLHDALPI